jgi:hypothetical protein
MRKIKITVLAASAVLMLNSCDNLEGLNDNTKAFEKPVPEALFTSAQKEYGDFLTNASSNENVFRLWAQHWNAQAYPTEARYDIVSRNIPNTLQLVLYRDVLKDLTSAKKLIEATPAGSAGEAAVKKNKLAIIEIEIVTVFQTAVDLFGNIPYSDALLDSPNYTPKYDDAKTVYFDLAARLDVAIANLDVANGSFSKGSDIIYNGNVPKWKKLANSIKLKMGLHLADVDAAKAKTMVESAVASGVISSNADNALIKYLVGDPNWNPLFPDLSSRNDFTISKYFADDLNAKSDPRRDYFFEPTSKIGGAYVGSVYGSTGNYAMFSHATDKLKSDQTVPGVFFDYAETSLLLADAANRGFAVGAAADVLYTNGITANMQYWGVPQADIDTYLARTDVAFATATGTAKQKVAYQLWVAYYNRGFEAWTEYRRLDFPVLVAPSTATAAAEGKVPVRLTYSHLEPTLNGSNYTAASTAIGGDKLTTKLFWDKF